jgi:hypothetical protein
MFLFQRRCQRRNIRTTLKCHHDFNEPVQPSLIHPLAGMPPGSVDMDPGFLDHHRPFRNLIGDQCPERSGVVVITCPPNEHRRGGGNIPAPPGRFFTITT